jgi:hypothetical protein
MSDLTDTTEQADQALDLLVRLGSKWAVLTAMSVRMRDKAIDLGPTVDETLMLASVKIKSGCYSPCEVTCSLAQAESQLFSKCHLLGDEEFMDWSDLLGEAMRGKLTYERIAGISALRPVKSECGFLRCTCS